jgi:hypothetical protein
VPQKEDCRMGQQWIQKLALPNAQEGLRRSRQYVAQCVLVDFAVILILVVLLVKKNLNFYKEEATVRIGVPHAWRNSSTMF